MRRLMLVLTLIVLPVFARPGWSCPWIPPTDPCLSEEQVEAQFLAKWEARQREEAVTEIVTETQDVDPAEEPSMDCEDAVRRLEDADPGIRLSVLDQVARMELDLDECPVALAAFQELFRTETDTFVLYRALLAVRLPFADVEPETIVTLLRHPSTDVRRIAAELAALASMTAEQETRVAKALAREKDPAVRLALATFDPEETDSAPFTEALFQLVREGGETAPAALSTLAGRSSEPQLLLESLSRSGALRALALDLLPNLLGREGDRGEIRDALLQVLREGTLEERIGIASELPYDPSGSSTEAWLRFVGDTSLPLRTRALLVLHAGYPAGWREQACAVKRADPALSAEVDAILGDEDHLYEAMHSLFASRRDPDDRSGTIQPAAGDTSVRCALRPDGPPRPGQPRLAAGSGFAGANRFTEDGVEWISDWDDTCWIPAQLVRYGDPPKAAPAYDVLEADLSFEALPAFQTAISDGDLELFDPVEDYTGIRLRGVSPELQERWRSGQDGVFEVLAAVEAKARLRAQNR